MTSDIAWSLQMMRLNWPNAQTDPSFTSRVSLGSPHHRCDVLFPPRLSVCFPAVEQKKNAKTMSLRRK